MFLLHNDVRTRCGFFFCSVYTTTDLEYLLWIQNKEMISGLNFCSVFLNTYVQFWYENFLTLSPISSSMECKLLVYLSAADWCYIMNDTENLFKLLCNNIIRFNELSYTHNIILYRDIYVLVLISLIILCWELYLYVFNIYTSLETIKAGRESFNNQIDQRITR